MPRKVKNLLDKTFGLWKVIKYIGNSYWTCKCKCGKISNIRGHSLTSRDSKGCIQCSGASKRINLSNKTFGFWKVKKYYKDNQWYCECKCGHKSIIRGQELREGGSTRCRNCYTQVQINDITGKQFGVLTAIERCYRKNGTYWKCQCICGKYRFIDIFLLIKRNKNNVCLCDYVRNHPLKSLYTIAKRGAKSRNLEFSLNRDELYDILVKQNFKCALTGLKLVIGYKNKESTASIDRIDSSKGYIKGNIQWLHKYINIMKLDHSQKDFIKMCNLVTEWNNK